MVTTFVSGLLDKMAGDTSAPDVSIEPVADMVPTAHVSGCEVASTSQATPPEPSVSVAPLPTVTYSGIMPDPLCAFCGRDKESNKAGIPEELVSCAECGSSGHPTCLEITDPAVIAKIKRYKWLCQECKRCEVCRSEGGDDEMLFCDTCDRGWHSHCLVPPLTILPEGPWSCPICRHQTIPRHPKSRPAVAPSKNTTTPRSTATPRSTTTPRPKTPRPSRPKAPGSRKRGRPRKGEEVHRDLVAPLLVPSEAQSMALLASQALKDEPYGGLLDAEQAAPDNRAPDASARALWADTERQLAAIIRSQGGGAPPPPTDPDELDLALTLPVADVTHIRLGAFSIRTWYQAPFPEEYSRIAHGTLWFCPHCLSYFRSAFTYGRHALKCRVRAPPGDEIYRDGTVSVYEVDGRKSKLYCQNVCLLSKLFLDHKTLYYDVEPFLFYIVTETTSLGSEFVGYFSKEKRNATNNLSCIMTLPVRQRRGWGQFLIDFSYLLSRVEGRPGTPERPLSALGKLTYYAYWKLVVFRYVLSLSEQTSKSETDVLAEAVDSKLPCAITGENAPLGAVVDLQGANGTDAPGTPAAADKYKSSTASFAADKAETRATHFSPPTDAAFISTISRATSIAPRDIFAMLDTDLGWIVRSQDEDDEQNEDEVSIVPRKVRKRRGRPRRAASAAIEDDDDHHAEPTVNVPPLDEFSIAWDVPTMESYVSSHAPRPRQVLLRPDRLLWVPYDKYERVVARESDGSVRDVVQEVDAEAMYTLVPDEEGADDAVESGHMSRGGSVVAGTGATQRRGATAEASEESVTADTRRTTNVQEIPETPVRQGNKNAHARTGTPDGRATPGKGSRSRSKTADVEPSPNASLSEEIAENSGDIARSVDDSFDGSFEESLATRLSDEDDFESDFDEDDDDDDDYTVRRAHRRVDSTRNRTRQPESDDEYPPPQSTRRHRYANARKFDDDSSSASETGRKRKRYYGDDDEKNKSDIDSDPTSIDTAKTESKTGVQADSVLGETAQSVM